MSVIHFGPYELASVALVMTNYGEPQKDAAEAMATISRANTACFNYRYQGKAKAVTVEEIEAILNRGTPVDYLDSALRVVTMLHYNCREDRDYLEEEPGGMLALCEALRMVVIVLREGK